MVKSGIGYVSGGILSGSSQCWKKPAIWCFPAPQSYYEMLSKVCVDKLDSDNADASYLHTQTKKAGLLKPLVPHASLSLCTNKAGVIRLIRSSPAGFPTWPVKLPLPFLINIFAEILFGVSVAISERLFSIWFDG